MWGIALKGHMCICCRCSAWRVIGVESGKCSLQNVGHDDVSQSEHVRSTTKWWLLLETAAMSNIHVCYICHTGIFRTCSSHVHVFRYGLKALTQNVGYGTKFGDLGAKSRYLSNCIPYYSVECNYLSIYEDFVAGSSLLWDVITYPCLRYLLLATKSTYEKTASDTKVLNMHL